MPKKLTQEEWITKARTVHGDFFDYSKVHYVNSIAKVCIICPVHGKFWQEANSHLQGHKCPVCTGRKKKNTEHFIEDARKIHGDWYDYSLTDYKNTYTPVCIICPEHGEFWQKPNSHLCGRGCRECGYKRNSQNFTGNTLDFIEKARLSHGDYYDYSKVSYKGANMEVCVVCPIHGEFWQKPSVHLSGRGCSKCGYERNSKNFRYTTEEFIAKARVVHGDMYSYLKSKYETIKTPLIITCSKHGDFIQTPAEHLQGCGCPKCGVERNADKQRMSFEDFVIKANIVHQNKYTYVREKFKISDDYICVVCPKHGEFTQTHGNHLSGYGCPCCKDSHGERDIASFLNDNNIKYIRQYKVTPQQVLFGRNKFVIDFYIPDHNTFIEYHGEQHYMFVPFLHKTEDRFVEQQDRDSRLRKHCKENKIRLIEIPYTEVDNIDKILTKKLLKFEKKQ